MSRVRALLLILLSLLPAAVAQDLVRALPADTVFAIGVGGLDQHVDKLDEILAEAERLELASVITELFGTVEEELPDTEGLEEEIPEELRELDWLELFGNEAWLTVSVGSSDPLPAVTLTVRGEGESMTRLREALDRAVEEGDAELDAEGEAALFLFPIDEPDSPIQIVAVGHGEGVLTASTSAEVVRGVFRRLAVGASEAGLAENPAYSATLGSLAPGTSYSFLDLTALAAAVRPYSEMTGMEALVNRLLLGLGSVGAVGSVMRVNDDGITSETVRVPDEVEGEFAALITGEPGLSRDPLQFVPADALGVSVTHLDLPGWWNYLSDLARSSPELGNTDLDATIQEGTGIDIRSALFDWMGTEAAVINGDLGEAVTPGVASQNLLGNSIYAVSVTDEAAANEGLPMLFGTAAAVVSSFSDPTGQAVPQISQREVAGVDVTSYGMGPGITLAHAVVDGWALIATSDEVLDSALTARAAGGGLSGVLSSMAERIPADATAYSVSDYGATLAQSGSMYASQLQLVAGLSGGEVDFEALQEAGQAIEEFFAFLAERAGGSYSYTVLEADGRTRSESLTEFRW